MYFPVPLDGYRAKGGVVRRHFGGHEFQNRHKHKRGRLGVVRRHFGGHVFQDLDDVMMEGEEV